MSLRHYVKILERMEPYARRVCPLPADWAKALFDDLTEGGRVLTTVPLRGNARGPLIGLCGEKFFCEAGIDRERTDSLFISRVESASRTLPETQRQRRPAQYVLVGAGRSATAVLNPVRPMFGSPMADAPPSEPKPRVKASALLRHSLAGASAELRAAWGPAMHPAGPSSGATKAWELPGRPDLGGLDFLTLAQLQRRVASRLDEIRAPWSRFRLDRFVRLPPRTSMILNRQLSPGTLSEPELQALRDVFDIELLNAVVYDDRSLLLPLLVDLAPLALPAHVRSTVWCGMLAGLPEIELRRALHDSAAALSELAERPEEAEVWTLPLLEALTTVGETEGDATMLDRVQLIRDAPAPLRSLSDWAAQLQFQPRLEPNVIDSRAGEVVETRVGINVIRRRFPERVQPTAVSSATDATGDARRRRLARGDGDRAPETAPSPPPVPSLADETPPLPVLDEWVLRLGTPGRAFVAALSLEIGTRLADTISRARSPASMQDLFSLLEDLQDLSRALHGWSQRLPDPALLRALYDEAQAAQARARQALGGDVDLLLGSAPTPSELTEIVTALQRIELLESFPPWLRPNGTGGAAATALDWALWLCDAEARSQVAALLAVADDLALDNSALLAAVPPPSEGGDLEAHLRGALRSLIELEHAVRDLPAEHAQWVGTCLRAGETKTAVLQSAEGLEAMRPKLNASTFRAVIDGAVAAQSAADRDARIRGYGAALRFFELNLGTASEASIGQLESWIARQGDGGGDDREARDVAAHGELSVHHSWVGAEAARPPISYQLVAGLPYGRILVPIVLETGRPADYSLRLEIDAQSKGRQAWPSEWAKLGPREVEIGHDDWRKTEQQRYAFTLCLEVPSRAPSGAGELLDLKVTVRDAVRDTPLSNTSTLRWDAIERDVGGIALAWPEGVTPRYVETHPIGPQKKMQQIVDRAKGGSSFAVVAPRRFGKSTLVEYLADHFRSLGWVVPSPIVCTEYFDSAGFDYSRLWQEVSHRLEDGVGSGLRYGLDAGVPHPDAFGYVRRAAYTADKHAVVLLFDESQLFFNRSGGAETGDRLKDRLERHWAQRGDQELAPVLFGFVGLPSLLERAGANLCGLLRPIEAKDMNEADLNRLLLSVTNERLATTREARLKLISVAGNLFLLRTLVESLADRLNKDGRRWATWDDVVAIESELIRQLDEDTAQNVGQWLRDALNDADTINQWRPSREYPVALALAGVRRQGFRRAQDVLQRVRNVLNAWCAEINNGAAAHLSFTPVRVDEHLATLREHGVLDQLDFRSPLLEAWLVGQARNGYPRAAHNALVKAAHVTIRTPDGAEPIDEGGQATVLRFTEGGVQKAMRRAVLRDEHDQQRFLETSVSLGVLAQGEHRGEPGSQYIYDLEAVGFSEESNMTAVQIYRWIDGCDLGEKVGTLEAPLVADIGFRLALAVSLLHARHIIHRDIRPKNVVLSQQDKRPVLIDFGMARLESSPMVTVVPSEFSAPEVRSPSPHWSRSADIFGLGKTLLSLLRAPGTDSHELRQILAACVEEEPQRRPDATKLKEQLRAVRGRLQVEDIRRVFWASVLEQASPDRECAWFMEVLGKFQSSFEALHLRIHRDEFERATELADFLNQLLEAYPGRVGPQRLSLGMVKKSNEYTGDKLVARSVEFLHQARTWLSHGTGKRQRQERLLAQLGHPSADTMRALVLDGAGRIEAFLSLHSVRSIIERIYGA